MQKVKDFCAMAPVNHDLRQRKFGPIEDWFVLVLRFDTPQFIPFVSFN